MQNQRNLYVDLIKCLLIILVVLGHFIQYFQYKSDFSLFWSSKLFKFIYTFHMPLFMAISGYFAYFSIKRHPAPVYIISRLKYLLVPLLSWCLILSIVNITNQPANTSFLYHFLNTSLHSFWFVWSILFFSSIFCLLKKFKIDKTPTLIIVTLFILTIVPNDLRIIGKEFFIYFVIGYVLADKKIETLHRFCKKYLLIFLIITIICFIYWNPYLSYTDFFDLKGWGTYLFRVLLGIVSSVTVMEIMYWVYTKTMHSNTISYFSGIGQETLGIYLIQGVFIDASWIWIIPYVNIPNISLIYVIPSILFVILCYYFIIVISKNKISGFLLLGKK